MKRSVVLALVFVLALSAVSFGAVQDFGKFTVDVPAGWTANKDDETVGIVKDDKSASMSITVDSTEGATLKELADAFVEALKGKNLKAEGNGYTFEFDNGNGVTSRAVLNGDNKNYALIVITGAENAPDEVMSIINSLQEK